MSKKDLLSVVAVFLFCAGSSLGEQARVGIETSNTLELVAETEATPSRAEVLECQKADLVQNKNLDTTPSWMLEGPLNPGGECDDCAGGCQYSCTTHSQCAAQCPNGIGSCTQAGNCLCACICNYDGMCEIDEEPGCPDCEDANAPNLS